MEQIEETWQVEEIETISFDENGNEDGTWTGHAVTWVKDPSKFCFEMRDKLNADSLCELLNDECYLDETSIDASTIDNLTEWSNLITKLTNKERKLYLCKEEYKVKSDKLLMEAKKIKDETEVDVIKDKYGGNNDKTRKQYVKESLLEKDKEIKNLEFSIEYLKRRISFIKQLIYTKTVLLEVKNHQ